MACLLTTDEPCPEYQGLASIFEYTNADGGCAGTNCGQAAAATLLTFHGKLPADPEQARNILADLERCHPPDSLAGLLGTSRRRVIRMCGAFGLSLLAIEGEDALRSHIAQRNPVAVMLGVSAGRFLSFNFPGGHWMVAYGYDRDHIYLTNWGRMTWEEFWAGWGSFVPRLINMRLRGLTAWVE